MSRPFHEDRNVDGELAQLCWVGVPEKPPTMVATIDEKADGALVFSLRFGRRGDAAGLESQRSSCEAGFQQVIQWLERGEIPFRREDP